AGPARHRPLRRAHSSAVSSGPDRDDDTPEDYPTPTEARDCWPEVHGPPTARDRRDSQAGDRRGATGGRGQRDPGRQAPWHLPDRSPRAHERSRHRSTDGSVDAVLLARWPLAQGCDKLAYRSSGGGESMPKWKEKV